MHWPSERGANPELPPFKEQNSNWRLLLLNLGIVTLWKARDVAIVSPGVPIHDS
jgi:hypothetical protein